MTTKPKLEISPDDALHEELSELLGDEENWHNYPTVSYTHLTLPTIYSV